MVPIPWVPTLQVQGILPPAKTCMETHSTAHRVIGKRFKMHLGFRILVLGFTIPDALLTLYPLGESVPLTPCLAHFAISAQDEQEQGEPMRD